MANTLTASFKITADGSLVKTAEISRDVSTFVTDKNDFDKITQDYTNGTGNNQANEVFFDERTVATVTADNLDLAGSLTNPFGETITFATIRLILIAIDAPDGTKAIRLGPRGVTNAWQGPFGGVAATDYIDSYTWHCLNRPVTGWTVTAATADILGIYNPSAVSVVFRILILGTK
jgi:hypothetical protein